MELFELQKHIKEHTLPKLLVFYGTEYEIMNLYINEICKRYNLTKLFVDSANTAFSKAKGLSILRTNSLYISKYEKDFLSDDRNWNNVDKIGSNYIIIIQQAIDNRTKFYKQFESVAVDFKEQPIDIVKVMLSQQHNLCDVAITRLINNCSRNYSRCLKELNKIKALAKYNNCSQEDAYKKLITEKVIQEDINIEIPEFIQAVMTKNRNALKLYYKLVYTGVNNIVLLSWVYNAVKNQLLVQGTTKPSPETTGINYYFIKECFSRMNYYSVNELIKFLYLIKECEQGIKSGKFEEPMIIEYLLVNCMGVTKCTQDA